MRLSVVHHSTLLYSSVAITQVCLPAEGLCSDVAVVVQTSSQPSIRSHVNMFNSIPLHAESRRRMHCRRCFGAWHASGGVFSAPLDAYTTSTPWGTLVSLNNSAGKGDSGDPISGWQRVPAATSRRGVSIHSLGAKLRCCSSRGLRRTLPLSQQYSSTSP